MTGAIFGPFSFFILTSPEKATWWRPFKFFCWHFRVAPSLVRLPSSCTDHFHSAFHPHVIASSLLQLHCISYDILSLSCICMTHSKRPPHNLLCSHSTDALYFCFRILNWILSPHSQMHWDHQGFHGRSWNALNSEKGRFTFHYLGSTPLLKTEFLLDSRFRHLILLYTIRVGGFRISCILLPFNISSDHYRDYIWS